MKISVNIQSYLRPGQVLTAALFPNASIWAHQFESKAYALAYGDRVKILPDDLRGNLPKVKNYILDMELVERKQDWCLFLDDDISAIGYHEKCRQVILTPDTAAAFVEKHSRLCEGWGYYLWGVNVNHDKQCYREYSPFSTLSYVSSSFACFRRGVELRYDPRFPLKEDYDMTVQMTQRYRGLLRINKAFYIKKSMTNTGGCSTYRNTDRESEQLELLRKKWGSGIVKQDSLENSRSHKSRKIRAIDINPIIHIPLRGI